MKQRINLYVRQEKVRVPFSATTCLAIFVAAALLVAGGWGYVGYQLGEAQSERLALDDEKAALQAEIDAIAAERRQLVPSPALEAEVASLEKELTTKQAYLDLLGTLQPESRTAFSTLLQGLADQDLPELWLTRIEAGEGGRRFALEGGVLQADAVPRYLERLGAEPGYGQARFDDFALSEAETGLRFTLNARLVPGGGP